MDKSNKAAFQTTDTDPKLTNRSRRFKLKSAKISPIKAPTPTKKVAWIKSLNGES